jgi:hypothetical protein
MVPGPVRIQDGPRHHLADLAVKWRSLSQLPRIFVDFARGGTGLPISYPVALIMQGRSQAVQGILLSPSCTAALGHQDQDSVSDPPRPTRVTGAGLAGTHGSRDSPR